MIVADYVWRGWSVEEIVRQYPYLTPAEVHAAMTYYFDHREEIENELISETGRSKIGRRSHDFGPPAAPQRAGQPLMAVGLYADVHVPAQ